jgi:Spy/CpxP family protein refolding chaperone
MNDNRTKIWFSLFVLAVFCVGLAAGVIVDRRFGPHPPGPPFGRGGGPGGPGRGGPPPPGRLIERLDHELDLTDDQEKRIQKVFDDRRAHFEQVQQEMRQKAEQEQRELQAEIKKVLTPEQQQRFDKWIEQEPRGLGPGGRGRGRGGPPPGRPPDR